MYIYYTYYVIYSVYYCWYLARVAFCGCRYVCTKWCIQVICLGFVWNFNWDKLFQKVLNLWCIYLLRCPWQMSGKTFMFTFLFFLCSFIFIFFGKLFVDMFCIFSLFGSNVQWGNRHKWWSLVGYSTYEGSRDTMYSFCLCIAAHYINHTFKGWRSTSDVTSAAV